ncbi:hypothetical protein GTZ97_14495 [Aquabacterium fontiphilum]|jgi:hypothetical protein|uniref:hypothetical protein n=1 Tax=Aquabacterium fontiphilum TaxID=450365 RepID=UPI001377A448|nr:hypothetical protein [Aquabacterium fontiphilum]NBD21868.1 hypothetical protein [Aquabacterium fontiphilum]
MTGGPLPSRPRPAHVPVLTEVIDLPGASPVVAPAAVVTPTPELTAPLVPPVPPTTTPAVPSEAQITQRVMQDVQRQVDGMLEFRLREAMAPVLARHTDALVQELRQELSRTLRDVVARAVAQEMARLRQR